MTECLLMTTLTCLWIKLMEQSAGIAQRWTYRSASIAWLTMCLPIRGLSEVGGIVSATMLRKNVSDRRTVTSTNKIKKEKEKSAQVLAKHF